MYSLSGYDIKILSGVNKKLLAKGKEYFYLALAKKLKLLKFPKHTGVYYLSIMPNSFH